MDKTKTMQSAYDYWGSSYITTSKKAKSIWVKNPVTYEEAYKAPEEDNLKTIDDCKKHVAKQLKKLKNDSKG